MAYNLPATRLLMNRLRQMMAEDGETRSRLDNVVRLIASTMVADVCSIYLREPSGQLILIATEGLKPEAVGNTRLSSSEGLVGLVSRRAEPMAIQDAPRHPSFSYRPETGEDPFHAFLGVPILRGGRVIGVLTAQNRTERVYGDEEIDTLQTIAMVLAEIVDRIDPEHLDNGHGHQRTRKLATLRGRVFCEGLGYGRAVLHDPVVPAAKFFAGDQEIEAERLTRALEDLDNRLLRILGGDDGRPEISEERSVLVARRLGPAELLEYANAGLRGILMEEAAASSHAAIVARALGIPTLGGIEGLTTRIDQGDWLIVDAEQGVLHVRPDDALYDAYKDRVALRSERQAAYAALRNKPARTRDGTDVSLMLNAGLELDLDTLEQTGADGVGLFRTEFQFLVSETLPRLDDQVQLYRRVLDKAPGKPVIFRTLDLGGDKVLPALNLQREENPALGWRSIRFALDHRGLFRRQLRALIRAAGENPLTVMFPMVTVPQEFFAAKDLLMKEVDWTAETTGKRPSRIEVGVMLETPALAFSLKELAGEAEFLSVGTNDLMQFFYAADRMTPSVSDRYDLVSPSALRFLKMVSEECQTHGIRMSACGEATGSSLSALCFVALGFTNLSMSAGSIGPVKRMIRSLDLTAFRADFIEALDKPNDAFRNQLLALAAEHGVELAEG